MSRFHFPAPGELHNPSGIPMSETDVFRLVVAAAPMLIASGDVEGDDDPLNGMLHAWWNAMNALPRELRIAAQKVIRKELGALPAGPWEEVNGMGDVIGPELDTSYLDEVWEQLNGETE
jgi:hypothetical protein